MTAVINSYEGKFENIAHSIKVAKDMGIDVIIPKWNEIKGRTWTDNKNIYLGFNSIKNLNQNKGDVLNQSATKIEYDNFFDVVRQIQEKTKELGHKIGDSDISQMIELNMFSEFGSISHVRELYKLYSYRDRKSIQKKQIHKTPFTEEYIRQYSGGETDKSFTKVDFNSLIDNFEIKTTPNPFDKLIAQSTYIGVPLSIIPNLKSNMTGILLDIIRTSYNNIIYKFYSLKTGLTLELKNKNKSPNEFEKGDLVEVTNFKKDRKWKVYEDENGKKVFDRVDINEFLCYSMIKLNKERISDYLR